MLRNIVFKQDQVNEGGMSGGGAAPKEIIPSAAKDEKAPEKVEEAGSNFDEYGYAKAPSVDAGKETEVEGKKDTKEIETKLEEIKDPGTGYGVKPIEVPTEEVIPEVPAAPKEGDIDVKGLSDTDATLIKEFSKANGLSKEQAQKFADLKKNEVKQFEESKIAQKKQMDKEIAILKASWDKELRTHATFGGDKFAQNVVRAEKVLTEFMSETKKALTERGSMLPPYVMRDLAKLADHLYSNEKFVQGNSESIPKVEVEKEVNHLDFYI